MSKDLIRAGLVENNSINYNRFLMLCLQRTRAVVPSFRNPAGALPMSDLWAFWSGMSVSAIALFGENSPVCKALAADVEEFFRHRDPYNVMLTRLELLKDEESQQQSAWVVIVKTDRLVYLYTKGFTGKLTVEPDILPMNAALTFSSYVDYTSAKDILATFAENQPEGPSA